MFEKEVRDIFLEERAISLTECAKVLGINKNEFIKELTKLGYTARSPKVNKIVTFDRYKTRTGNGIFYQKEELNYYNGHTNIQLKVTPLGVEFFMKYFEDKKGIEKNGNYELKGNVSLFEV